MCSENFAFRKKVIAMVIRLTIHTAITAANIQMILLFNDTFNRRSLLGFTSIKKENIPDVSFTVDLNN